MNVQKVAAAAVVAALAFAVGCTERPSTPKPAADAGLDTETTGFVATVETSKEGLPVVQMFPSPSQANLVEPVTVCVFDEWTPQLRGLQRDNRIVVAGNDAKEFRKHLGMKLVNCKLIRRID